MKILLLRFLHDLETFEYEMSSMDKVWSFLFADNTGRWHKLCIVFYDNAFQIRHHEYENGCLLINEKKEVSIVDVFGHAIYKQGIELLWHDLIAGAHAWLHWVEKDWIRAANRVVSECPLSYRRGIVPHAIVREVLPDRFPFYKELGIRNCRKIVQLVESGTLWKPAFTEVASMTATRYFEYCKIAYLASAEKSNPVDASLSGREMYKQYADGRHGGLLDIEPESESAFANWLDGKDPDTCRFGTHPWEIRRGGNTTHIDLSVRRPFASAQKGYLVELCGESFTRMAETIKMCLAIHAAGLPITIVNPENVRKRILGQDNVGVIPSYESAHRANQYFPAKQCVYDVLHFREVSRYKRRVLPFITWEPLPVLKPK